MAYFTGVDRKDIRIERARQALTRATELDPDLPYVKSAWAHFYYRAERDYDRALQLYREVQQALPNFRTPLIGYILRRQGFWEESLAEMLDVFQSDPRDADLACQIGISYQRMRRYDEAEEWFQRSLAIAPDYLRAHINRALIPLLASGDIDAAAARCEAIGQDHPSIQTIRYYLALCRRDYQAALDVITRATGDAFYEFDSYLQKNLAYAQVYAAMGEKELMRFHAEAAALALNEALGPRPNDARIRSSLGLALAYQGRNEQAVLEGLRACELESMDIDAASAPQHILNLAMIYTIVGDRDRAVERLSNLVTIPAGHVVTVPMLSLDPCWDPLRGYPPFERLLER
jgi:Flp pilus assembly protein TadD